MKNCHLYPHRSVSAVGAEKKVKIKGEGKQVSLFEFMGVAHDGADQQE